MSKTRRDFMHLAAVSAAATGTAIASAGAAAAPAATIKAVAFDGFALIDPRPVAARAEAMFAEHGKSLMAAWRTHQFGYAWLRTLGGQYVDFWRVTQDALEASARTLKLSLTASERDALMQTYLELKAWPDAAPVLRRLKDAGLKLAFLSNFTAAMLDAAARNSGLEGLLEAHLSTDRVQAYKPDPRAYAMALDAFGLRRNEIAFVAFAGWDLAGAKWFGYPTYWANRAAAPADQLGVTADAEATDLSQLAAFVEA
ncbi:MAG TPA: haloacid dehalogenase type II [Dongiaceae bacterium]|nr:haloacid dehalogenase type II [Dongiaceae bacterium]